MKILKDIYLNKKLQRSGELGLNKALCQSFSDDDDDFCDEDMLQEGCERAFRGSLEALRGLEPLIVCLLFALFAYFLWFILKAFLLLAYGPAGDPMSREGTEETVRDYKSPPLSLCTLTEVQKL